MKVSAGVRRRPRAAGEYVGMNFAEAHAAGIVRRVRAAIVSEFGIQPGVIALLAPGTIHKTPSGKIQRHSCRASYLSGDLGVVQEARRPIWLERAVDSELLASAPPPKGLVELEAWVLMRLRELEAPEDMLRQDTELAQLGIDSLRFVELGDLIEFVFGISIKAADLFEIPTIGAMVRMIAEALGLEPTTTAPHQEADPGGGSTGRRLAGNDRLRAQRAARRQVSAE